MAAPMLPVAQWNYYRFENTTNAAQQVTGLIFNRDFANPQTVSLLPGEQLDGVPLDERFIDQLTGNYLLKVLGLAPLFGFPGCSITPFPGSSAPGLIRLVFATPIPFQQADILRGLALSGEANMFVTMCESPQYAGPQILLGVEGVPGAQASWIEFSADLNVQNQIDLRNGSIQASFGLGAAASTPTPQGTFLAGVLVRVIPLRDPEVPYNSSQISQFNQDTWAYLGEMNAPRHSGVGALLSNGNALFSHGEEPPFNGAWAASTWCVVNPVTGQITNYGDNNVNGTVVAGYDRGFTKESIKCADGKHRVYVAVGFSSNDEVLNTSPCIEAYTEESNSWDGATALHFQLIQTNPGTGAGPYFFGTNYMNVVFPDAPPLPPLLGLGGAPPDGTAGKILQPKAAAGAPIGPFGTPPGQYSFTTGASGTLPGSGFSFSTLFTTALVQFPNGFGPPPNLGSIGTFSVDPAAGAFYFSPNVFSASKAVMMTTPYWLKPVSATAPGPDSYSAGVGAATRGFVCGMEPLPDGRIAIVGGFYSDVHSGILYTTVTTKISMLDTATGLCTDVGNLLHPSANEPHNAVLHPNGNIYVFGGFLTPFFPGPVLASPYTQIYNTSTNVCTLGATNPICLELGPGSGYSRPCNPVVLPDGGILLSGGAFIVGAAPSGNIPPTPRSFIYYPDTDSWVETNPMKVALCAGWSRITDSGMVLQISGAQHGNLQSDRQLTQAVQQFDYRTRSWALLANLPPQIGGHWYRTVLHANRKISVAGGISSVARNSLIGQPMTSVNLYSPTL